MLFPSGAGLTSREPQALPQPQWQWDTRLGASQPLGRGNATANRITRATNVKSEHLSHKVIASLSGRGMNQT
jgi:hypothetical protein